MTEGLLWLLAAAHLELTLFAAVGILIGGIDDLLVDLIWIIRSIWRRLTVYRVHARACTAVLTPSAPGRLAVFVAAWNESAVIGPMVRTALARWTSPNFRLYVGCYPNDAATRAVLAEIADPRLRVVVNPRAGPTTKADNLNSVWRALLADEARDGQPVKAVVLHDAEDLVHPHELRIFDALIERFSLVQLPVLPLIEQERGFWARAISATYADEFAEAHAKQMVVREAVGAGLPSAGVGCAFAREMLGRIAGAAGTPFDAASVTEDYELGLRIRELGGRAAFVRLPGRPGGRAVAVRAHFPDVIEEAVRQKARWVAGIALSGWRRLGWRGGLAERWMRLRDRRAILAALVLFAAYLSLAGSVLFTLAGRPPHFGPGLEALILAATLILVWRIVLRAICVGREYGLAEALRSVPRMVLGNLIAIAASRRGLVRYVREARGGTIFWDKTAHRFPRTITPE